jgi:hypothetical protein
VYVLIQDYGTFLGGANSTRLIANTLDDVFIIKNGAVVGQGINSGLLESPAMFEAHFR